mmetsp:Transcript_99500/g.249449  ORF Transcript_99500/g.249449 Transcript_99500/m.249449 type:complete len:248 (-) Transcript_99500:843-1586(-)
MMRQLEEGLPIQEQEAGYETLRAAEQLVPIIIVCNIWGQEVIVTCSQFLDVFLVALIDSDLIIPLIEDNVIDRPHDLGKEVAAAVCCWFGLREAGAFGSQRQLSDEVDDFWHESHVACLAPHKQEGSNLSEARRQLHACIAIGSRVDDAAGELVPLNAPQLRELCCVPGRDSSRFVSRQFGPPPHETVQQFSMQVSNCCPEQDALVNLLIQSNGPVSNHCALGAPQGQQVLELVPDTVGLQSERLAQ